ncbi:hypothetical protein PT277_03115 [Acetobacteraceae bacterium ESL0709]|nr:hypothetical protein [Acetobacteraceae bacterium ESL0697]MDF7677692.1 hypothetical protein [Acetobacteraceae bacterium ESL0709]
MNLPLGRKTVSFISSTAFILGLSQGSAFFTKAGAQEVHFGQPYEQDTNAAAAATAAPKKKAPSVHGGEHYRARGTRPPPEGYQEAPSMEFQNGPDPDHQAKVQRDKTTGTDLTKFGTAYRDSNPMQQGEMGDATGNGWVAPRGNGFQY